MVAGFSVKNKEKDNSQEELIKNLYEQIGQLTVERDWIKKNLVSLAVETKKQMVDIYNAEISISRQCELVGLSRSSYYFKHKELERED